MDVEIVKKNGKVFRLSDYGVVQDFVVSSIDKRTHRENIDGRPGAVNYGSYDGDRTITVPFIFKARDLHDFVHLRDELYGLLDDNEPFYIREMRRVNYLQYEFVDFGEGHKWSPGTDDRYVNGKQILVRMNSVISPEQEFKNGKVDLEFVSYELPYFETIYSTLELHDSGYSATAEKYGLVDNIDVEKVNYRFEPDLDVISFDNPTAWEVGSINSISGALTDSTTQIRMKNYISITPGKEYTIKETLDTPNLRQWWVIEYDNNNDYVGYVSTPYSGPVETTFIARGSKLKLRSAMISGNTITPSDVGVITIPELTSKSSVNTFTVYNAGNVTVEPESMLLNFRANAVHSANNFTIRNKTTGEEIVLKRASYGSHFVIRGMVISFGSFTNIFRDTNRRFISLAPGDNEFEILNGTFSEMRFDFRYLYK